MVNRVYSSCCTSRRSYVTLVRYFTLQMRAHGAKRACGCSVLDEGVHGTQVLWNHGPRLCQQHRRSARQDHRTSTPFPFLAPQISKPHTPSHAHRDRTPGAGTRERSHPDHTHQSHHRSSRSTRQHPGPPPSHPPRAGRPGAAQSFPGASALPIVTGTVDVPQPRTPAFTDVPQPLERGCIEPGKYGTGLDHSTGPGTGGINFGRGRATSVVLS